jgi:hypothetical protein
MGFDTMTANIELGFKADPRDYDLAAGILKDLGITNIELLTNNPAKIISLESNGITVTKRVPMVPQLWGDSLKEDRDDYLYTKIKKMGHLLTFPNQTKGCKNSEDIARNGNNVEKSENEMVYLESNEITTLLDHHIDANSTKELITDKRGSLCPATIRAIQCLKSWLK